MEQTVAARNPFRTNLFLFTLIVVAIGAVLAGLSVFTLLPKDLGAGYGAVITTVQGLGGILAHKVAVIYVFIVLGIIAVMSVLHIVYSHRIAGPAFRLSREAAKISEGNLAGKIKFRRKDDLTDMADTLNDLADRHRERVLSLKDRLSHVEAQADALNELMRQGRTDSSVEQAAESLLADLRNINKILAEIRA